MVFSTERVFCHNAASFCQYNSIQLHTVIGIQIILYHLSAYIYIVHKGNTCILLYICIAYITDFCQTQWSSVSTSISRTFYFQNLIYQIVSSNCISPWQLYKSCSQVCFRDCSKVCSGTVLGPVLAFVLWSGQGSLLVSVLRLVQKHTLHRAK